MICGNGDIMCDDDDDIKCGNGDITCGEGDYVWRTMCTTKMMVIVEVLISSIRNSVIQIYVIN